jgi:heme/copper-type cytochrome/quinol oxidase subunit 2
MNRILIVGIAIVVAAGLFLVFRPDDSDEPSANPPPATVGTTGEETTTVTATTAPPPPPPGPPPPAQVRIVVRGGLPVGGPRRVTVARNRRVVLTVTSDVSDHVHLHGYDLMQDVGPGMPARIAFRATRPGTVEAELEDAGVQIARITAQ